MGLRDSAKWTLVRQEEGLYRQEEGNNDDRRVITTTVG